MSDGYDWLREEQRASRDDRPTPRPTPGENKPWAEPEPDDE